MGSRKGPLVCKVGEFKKKIGKAKFSAVLFEQVGCEGCRLFAPHVPELRRVLGGVPLTRISLNGKTEDCENLADRYNVEETPTILIFKDGKMIRKVIPDNRDDYKSVWRTVQLAVS